MNAVNPLKTSIAPDDPSPAAEPSMEEILASIRRIIADDQSFPGRAAPDPAATHEPSPGAPDPDAAPPSAEFETGDEPMHVLRPPIPDRAMPHEASQAGAADPSDAVAPAHAVHAPQFASPEGPGSGTPLLAPEVAGTGSVAEDLEAALAATFSHAPEPQALETHAPEPRAPEPRAPEPPGAQTGAAADNLFSPAIDSSVTTAFNTLAASRLVASSDELRGLVREMIRPLLKSWIDEHLPIVVERLVAAEIERIARGGT